MKTPHRASGFAVLVSAFAAFLPVAGCGGANDTYTAALVRQASPIPSPTPTPPAGAVTIQASPTPVTLSPGGVQTFIATVSGTQNVAVLWSVIGGASNGTITPQGVYTAPGTPGVYNILATSQADPSRQATVIVTVQAISPGNGGLDGIIQ